MLLENTDTISSTSSKYKLMQQKIAAFRKKIENFLEHYIYVILMTVITIYVLFADDVRTLISDKSVDYGFFMMATVALCLFGSEIVLSSIARPGYFLGFFFWLDIISTASLIFDIGWISDLILGTGSGASGAAGAAKLARAGRASRVGTRAGRIVRIVRLVRLIRIVKLYKAAQTTIAAKHLENDDDDDSQQGTLPRSSTVAHGHREDSAKDGSAHSNHSNNSVGNVDKHEVHSAGRKESYNAFARQTSTVNEKKTSTVHGKSQFAKPTESHEPKAATPDGDHPAGHGANADQDVAQSPEQVQNEQIKSPDNPNEPLVDSPALMKGVSSVTPGDNTPGEPVKEKFEIPQETNVGKKLSDLTTRRVITLVMSVLVSIPIFDLDTYWSDLTSCELGLNTLQNLYTPEVNDPIAFDLAYRYYIDYHDDIRNALLVLVINQTQLYSVLADEDSLRDAEKTYFNIQDPVTGETISYALFDQRDDTKLNAILSMSGTIFVIIVLTAAALAFSKDSSDLVIVPIEKMIKKVQDISENPLNAARIEEEDALAFEDMAAKGLIKRSQDKDNFETAILERTILKLGGLLALGFGEAGSNIIAQNMAKSGDVDPMIPGSKCMGIFGFCDIRQFTDATEVLQEGVMVFVNEIAQIVHGTINDFSGAANKNIGDAFLLVWKIPDSEVEVDPDDPTSKKLKDNSVPVNALADMAVFSFVKVLAGTYKSRKLDKYRHHEGLNKRIKNYSVKMGMGLHVGWAIEGAIGSEFKIDASYLSPNVNMASRLEAATKQFGVPVLISGAVAKICSAETQKQLRHIDRVAVKGSVLPIDLYTCDVELSRLSIDKAEKEEKVLNATELRQKRFLNRVKRDDQKEKAFAGKMKVAKKFLTDKDIALIRKPFSNEFMNLFKEGMDNYIGGNWAKARDIFEITVKMVPIKERDGPSVNLLTFMAETGYRAPHNWKGFRELTEK